MNGQHLISAAIVDAFIKARDDFSDNKTSFRQDIRHGLETVAPVIAARAAPEMTDASMSVLNYAGIDAWLDAPGGDADVWGIRKEDLRKLRAANPSARAVLGPPEIPAFTPPGAGSTAPVGRDDIESPFTASNPFGERE